MSYQDDKRELLKLKQGIINEEESEIHEEEKPVYEVHGIKKVENFFYHYKWYVVAGIFFAAVFVFMMVSLLQKEQGDIRVLVVTKNKGIASNVMYKMQEFEKAFELYCPDYDNSGYIHVDVYNVDLSENPDPQYSLAGVTKLTGLSTKTIHDTFKERFWAELTPAEKQRLMHLLVERVAINDDGVDIEFKTSEIKSVKEAYSEQESA